MAKAPPSIVHGGAATIAAGLAMAALGAAGVAGVPAAVVGGALMVTGGTAAVAAVPKIVAGRLSDRGKIIGLLQSA